MSSTLQTLGIDRMSREERIRLAGEIWDSLSPIEQAAIPQSHPDELDERLAPADTAPDAGTPGEELRTRLRVIRLILLALIAICLPLASVHSQDEATVRKEQLAKLQAEYETKLNDYRTAANAATTPAESEAAEKLRPSIQAFGKRFLALAKQVPTDDVACDALIWIASNYARREKMDLDEALDLIEKHHLKSPKLKMAVDSLAASDAARAKVLITTLMEKGGDREVRGWACLFVAYNEYGQLDPDGKVEPLMQRIKKDFADVKLGDKLLGKLADGMLFELKHLIPGKAAPDIVGVDVAGQKLKLSDYRGKVVLLVFWGSWCGPCMAEIPDLKKRIDQYAGRPFTIVGVNCGDEKAVAAGTIKTQKLGWPHFFDGVDGPIAERWNVLAFPTMYVIDAKGIIRSKMADEIDEAIEVALRGK